MSSMRLVQITIICLFERTSKLESTRYDPMRRGYLLAAEQRPSIFFTDDTRMRCAPSAAPAIFPERTSPSGGATVPATSTRCPSSLPNSASCPVSA